MIQQIPLGLNRSSKNKKLYEKAIDLRKRTLWRIQRPTPTFSTYFKIDNESNHFIAKCITTDTVIGTLTLHENLIRQVAVDPAWTGLGIGTSLMRFAIDRNQNQDIQVNSFVDKVDFYSKFGFVKNGEPYMSQGQQCQRMIKVAARKK